MSSFSTLRDYNFDVIKLDMGFVQKLGENKKYNNIVMSIIELAHRLDMKVDRKSTRLNSSHSDRSRMPSSA